MRTARGFTLIELLVAISVMSLLALISWRGLDSMSRAQAMNRERGDGVLTLQTTLSQWGADLASSAQKQGKVLPSLTVAQRFDAALPRLVAPDAA